MIPGIVIAGTHSGVGKTTVTLGIMSLLVKRGFKVQGFKVGPDYIDPSFYRGITGRPGENLDGWMTTRSEVKRIYLEGSQGGFQRAQLAVVEGVMGLFDGAKADSESGSTAEIAKNLDLPIILVIDARSMARSVAALIKGFTEFDPELKFGGIIFNRVGSEKHFKILTDATKTVTDIKILGFLPKEITLSLPERHLGLVPFYENPEFGDKLSKFADLFSATIDLDSLIKIFEAKQSEEGDFSLKPNKAPVVRIGVALDEGFGFYYQDNLRLLEQAGAELVFFSPLNDCRMPSNLNGLYIGGGYPEIFARQLAANTVLKAEIKALINTGLPTYAECGGLMYLAERLKTPDGEYPMLEVLNLEIEMTGRRETLGYTEVTAIVDNLLLKSGETARGHEFHYSRITKSQEKSIAYRVKRGESSGREGFVRGNLLASYVHLHFASNPGMAENFIQRCRVYRELAKE